MNGLGDGHDLLLQGPAEHDLGGCPAVGLGQGADGPLAELRPARQRAVAFETDPMGRAERVDILLLAEGTEGDLIDGGDDASVARAKELFEIRDHVVADADGPAATVSEERFERPPRLGAKARIVAGPVEEVKVGLLDTQAPAAGLERPQGLLVAEFRRPDFCRYEDLAPRESAVPDGPPRGSERILLLDDELVQIQSVRAMLRMLGYEVVALTDGQEALTRIRADPQAFDLLITDQTMPHLTGVKLAKEVLGIRPDLPIILCTGYSEAVDANEARALGIRDFLMKPYSVREMAEAVRRALSGNPGKKP